MNTFKGRCHDAIFLESEPADRVRSYDFGLERDMSVAVYFGLMVMDIP